MLHHTFSSPEVFFLYFGDKSVSQQKKEMKNNVTDMSKKRERNRHKNVLHNSQKKNEKSLACNLIKIPFHWLF